MSRSRPDLDVSPYTLACPTQPFCWSEVFGDDREVELEVGSGKGLFLANAGQAEPGRGFVGVEVSRKYARLAAERVAKLGLRNVRVVTGDIRPILASFAPSGGLRALHLYFPDPWWKTRHRKRRVFCESFVRDAARVLAPGGDLRLATDVEEYFGVMRDLMATHEEFLPQPLVGPTAPEHELDYLTNFERKYRLEGRPIYRAHYRLRTAGVEGGEASS